MLNGYLVIRTGLPSFIVTLAFYFILRGLSLALSTMLTGKTIVSSNEGVALRDLATGDYLFSTLFSGHVLTGFFNAMAHWGWIAARGRRQRARDRSAEGRRVVARADGDRRLRARPHAPRATGSSPPAAMPMQRRTPVSRSRASRSASSS